MMLGIVLLVVSTIAYHHTVLRILCYLACMLCYAMLCYAMLCYAMAMAMAMAMLVPVPDTTHTTYTTGHVVSHNTLVLLQHT